MKKINWKQVGNVAKDVCVTVGTLAGTGLLIGAAAALQGKLENGMTVDRTHEVLTGSYDNAVKAIMNSDMMSYYKVEAVNSLKKDGDPDYYKAVISVVSNSETMDYYRAKLVQDLKTK